MTLENVYLRNITENDLELIFNWANEKEARKNSFNKEDISYKQHKEWFLNKMKNKDMFYILQQDDAVIGQIRVEKIDIGLLISYSIDVKKRGKGYGKIYCSIIRKRVIKI